jgi:hypothetical protein
MAAYRATNVQNSGIFIPYFLRKFLAKFWTAFCNSVGEDTEDCDGEVCPEVLLMPTTHRHELSHVTRHTSPVPNMDPPTPFCSFYNLLLPLVHVRLQAGASTASGTNTASYLMGSTEYLPEGKAAVA